jgi:hypothetical protein
VSDTTKIQLTGQSALIVHAWSEKAKRQILDKQMKVAAKAKEAKDPEQQYKDCFYYCDDGAYGFPSIAFKAAAVRAGTYRDMKMTFLRGAFHVNGEYVRITGEPRMREDMVRVGSGVADIRYRPEFPDWAAELSVTFNPSALSEAQLLDLFDEAGFAVGIGEWRPEKNGQYGRFSVVR